MSEPFKCLERGNMSEGTCKYSANIKCKHLNIYLAAQHWLPVEYRVDFKIFLITFKTLLGPLKSQICSNPMSQAAACDPLAGPSSLLRQLASSQKANGRFQSKPRSSGTPCLRILGSPIQCILLNHASKLTFTGRPFIFFYCFSLSMS